MRFHEHTKAMYLASIHPGVTTCEVGEATGFPLDMEVATETIPPNVEELRILREVVDPQRIFLR